MINFSHIFKNSLAVIVLISLFSLVGYPEDRVIQTRAKIQFEGKTSRSHSMIRISGTYTDVFLTDQTLPVPVSDDQKVSQAIYLFNQPLINALPKGRPKINLVTTNYKRGQTDAEGITQVTLTDPDLGDLAFKMAITKVTPQRVHWVGVEYDHALSFSLQFNSRLAFRLVEKTIDEKDPGSRQKAALFFAQAGVFDRASSLLEGLSDGKETELIRSTLANEKLKKFTKQADILQLRGELKRANQSLSQLDESASLPPSLKDIAKQVIVIKGAEQWLDGKDWGISLSDRALYRLDNYLEKGLQNLVTQGNVKTLTHRWAEQLSELASRSGNPANEMVAQAIELAETMGAYLSSNGSSLDQTAALFTKSKLPIELKIDIAKYAPPQIPPNQTDWHQVDFVDPVTNGKFHYYLSYPPSYDPSTPLPMLVTLHGMTSTAEIMRRFWGVSADQHGYILVSPEYIYGRPSGFRYSSEEMRAILGAVEHASRTLPVDSSRVFLQGHSQGGHTAWEVGCMGAHRFSGIIPMLGITRRTEGLISYGSTPLYLIDGSLDGIAPTMIRDSMSHLNRLNIDATYVEYRNRKHEAFYEEYPRVMQWARAYRRKIATQIEYTAYRPSDTGESWLEILETKDSLPSIGLGGKTQAKLSARLSGNRIVIDSQNVRKLAVHIPWAWRKLGSLNIQAGRAKSDGKIKPSWNTLLNRLYLTGDRENLIVETRILNP